MNPYAVHFSQIKVSDLILVNEKSEIIQGDKPVNEAALVIHSAVHEADRMLLLRHTPTLHMAKIGQQLADLVG